MNCPYCQSSRVSVLQRQTHLGYSMFLGKVWLIDETFLRVKGVWCYFYRGIDEDGKLVDVRLNQTRDMAGTKAFFAQAIGLHEDAPEKVATDGLAAYPRAIEAELGQDTKHEGPLPGLG